ncbi:HYES hydrolase, partial [Zosterops hypoxanthus]|nr:HYES hydrolase [Zosterops hypoxanthus]
GFLTCVVANSWLDDGPGRAVTAALLTRLRRRFHLVLESCRAGSAKPDPGIVLTALETLRAPPQQV